MPLRLHHLKGSGDKSGDATKIRLMVFDASEHADAENFVVANTPPSISNAVRGPFNTVKEAPGLFIVEFEYKPEPGSGDGGSSGEGGAGQQGNPDKTKPVPTEFSMSIGGHTERIYKSISTIHSLKRGGGQAPNFKNMIGVSTERIEGAEVYSKQCDYTITKHYSDITVGYLLTLMDATARTNDAPFLGCPRGSTLFFGADVNYSGTPPTPWTISGKFGYKKNENNADVFQDLNQATTVPIEGWMYTWFTYEKTTENIGGTVYQIEVPQFAYTERVYYEHDYSELKME